MTYIIPTNKVSINRGKPKFTVNIGIKSDSFKTGWIIHNYNQLYNVIGNIYLDMFYVDIDDAVVVNGVILSNMIFVELYGKPILTSDNSKKFPTQDVRSLKDFTGTKIGDVFKRENTNDVFTVLSVNSYSCSLYNRIPFYYTLNQNDGVVRHDGIAYNKSSFHTSVLLDRIKEFPVTKVRNRELNEIDKNLIGDVIEESNIKTDVYKSKTMKDHCDFLKTFIKSDFTNFNNSNIDFNIMVGKINNKKVDIIYPLFIKSSRQYSGILYFDGYGINFTPMHKNNTFSRTVDDFTITIEGTKSELKNYFFNSLVRDSIIDNNEQVHEKYDPYEYCLVHRHDKIAVIHKSEFDKIKSIEMEVSEVVTNRGTKIKGFTNILKKRK